MLFSFTCAEMKICKKGKKDSKVFCDWFAFFYFLSIVWFVVHENSKVLLPWKKGGNFCKCCPFEIWTTVGAKFVLVSMDADNTFWKVSIIAVCHISVVLNVNFNDETGLRYAKICRKFQGNCIKLKVNCIFSGKPLLNNWN